VRFACARGCEVLGVDDDLWLVAGAAGNLHLNFDVRAHGYAVEPDGD
jgi:hypothetical protein